MEMPTCALIGHAVQLSLWERLVLAFRLVWGGWLYTAIHLEFHPDEEEVVSSSAPPFHVAGTERQIEAAIDQLRAAHQQARVH